MTTRSRFDNTFYPTTPRPKLVAAYIRPEENQRLWKAEWKNKNAAASFL